MIYSLHCGHLGYKELVVQPTIEVLCEWSVFLIGWRGQAVNLELRGSDEKGLPHNIGGGVVGALEFGRLCRQCHDRGYELHRMSHPI